MKELVTLMLANQTKTTMNGIEIILPILPHDTRKQRERIAKREAQKIIKLLN